MAKTFVLNCFKKSLFHKFPLPNRTERIYILPTFFGYPFVFSIFVLFLIGLSYGHNLAFSTTFLFFSMIMMSAVVTNNQLKLVNLKTVRNEYIVAQNEALAIFFNLENKSNQEKRDIECSSKRWKTNCVDIKEGSSQFLVVSKKIEQIGLYQLSKIGIKSSYPFDLFYSWKYFKVDISIFITPTPINHLSLALEMFTLNIAAMSSAQESQTIGMDEFYEHGKMGESDSWKTIDWKVFSKTQKLYKKQFISEEGRIVSLDIKKIHSSSKVIQFEQMAYLLHQAYNQGCVFNLVVDNQKTEFGSTREHLDSCLKLLTQNFRAIEELQ